MTQVVDRIASPIIVLAAAWRVTANRKTPTQTDQYGVQNNRLSLLSNGHVRYELKTPYRDGTTHVIFEPMDFIARLVALVPKLRVNLTRFHGVFAPNSAHRAQVTPSKRGKTRMTDAADSPAVRQMLRMTQHRSNAEQQ